MKRIKLKQMLSIGINVESIEYGDSQTLNQKDRVPLELQLDDSMIDFCELSMDDALKQFGEWFVEYITIFEENELNSFIRYVIKEK